MPPPDTARASRREALADAATGLSLDVPGAMLDTLLAYLDLLQRWNATYNLTAVRDPTEMLTQHLVDCLAVIAPLRRGWAEQGVRSARVLDVGSGGGLPGVVIAVLNPDHEVLCVDTVGKKAAFIRQAALELRLPRLRAEHARVEALKTPPVDMITARAFASLADLVQLTRRHLAPGGVWAAMKGKPPHDEIAALPADIDVFHVEPLVVPGLDAQRCLVWMRPLSSRPLASLS